MKASKYLIYFAIGFGFWIAAMWQTQQQKLLQLIHLPYSHLISRFTTCAQDAPPFLNDLVRLSLTKHQGLSVQVAYVDPHGHVSHCSGGLSNFRFVDSEDRYRYASMTKIVTADALQRTLDEHDGDVESRLLDFFPNIAIRVDQNLTKIKLVHLLNHQAGFRRGGRNGDPMFDIRKRSWCPVNTNALELLRLDFIPGGDTEYSNIGYCLLGEVISGITGRDYKKYIIEKYKLSDLDIQFVANQYADDEVQYYFSFESYYSNENHLTRLNYEDLSSAAGLSGSALALAKLLKTMFDSKRGMFANTFGDRSYCTTFNINASCYNNGIQGFMWGPQSLRVVLQEGYLPGVASIAMIDEYGGVIVITKSGKNNDTLTMSETLAALIYRRLEQYYVLNNYDFYGVGTRLNLR